MDSVTFLLSGCGERICPNEIFTDNLINSMKIASKIVEFNLSWRDTDKFQKNPLSKKLDCFPEWLED